MESNDAPDDGSHRIARPSGWERFSILAPRSLPARSCRREVRARSGSAAHGSFTGRLAEVSAAREEQEIFRSLRAVTLAFWDAYLDGDRQARAFLDPTGIAAESKGRAKLSRR